MKKILFFAGLLLCLFPLVSSVISRRHQRNAVATYQKDVAHSGQEELEAVMEAAKEYNSMLYQSLGGVLSHLQNGILSKESYLQQLNLNHSNIMGSIEIPKIDVNLPIYHGTEEESLAAGVGHLEESSLPVGGENTHSILTGHRGLPNAKLFTRLDEIEKKDLFFIRVCRVTMAYRVCDIKVVEPEDMSILSVSAGEDLVSLITCTPYGLNTHRLVVTGERVDYKEQEYKSSKAQMMSWREIIFSILPFLFVVIAIIRLLLKKRGVQTWEKEKYKKVR